MSSHDFKPPNKIEELYSATDGNNFVRYARHPPPAVPPVMPSATAPPLALC